MSWTTLLWIKNKTPCCKLKSSSWFQYIFFSFLLLLPVFCSTVFSPWLSTFNPLCSTCQLNAFFSLVDINQETCTWAPATLARLWIMIWTPNYWCPLGPSPRPLTSEPGSKAWRSTGACLPPPRTIWSACQTKAETAFSNIRSLAYLPTYALLKRRKSRYIIHREGY